MKILIIAILTWGTIFQVKAQEKDPISISVEIIAKGNAENSGPCDSCYFARFEVFNKEDTTLPITIWSCSWNWNWKSDSDSIWLAGWGCDANCPEIIKLPSQESLVFYGGIRFRSPRLNTIFRLAFANGNKEFNNYLYLPLSSKPHGEYYWSAPITFKGFHAYPNISKYFPEYFVTNSKSRIADNNGISKMAAAGSN
jgi:hypothetical protein